MLELSTDSQDYVRHVVTAGVFPDERTALDEAVSLLKKRVQLHEYVRAGLDQAARGDLLPAEEVFDRLEKRAAEIRRKAAI